jgi:hypothetical protein
MDNSADTNMDWAVKNGDLDQVKSLAEKVVIVCIIIFSYLICWLINLMIQYFQFFYSLNNRINLLSTSSCQMEDIHFAQQLIMAIRTLSNI